jgi:hypothetical protein
VALVRLALFPEGTRAQYDALARELARAPVPPERLVFAAGPVEGGWQVVQVWTSREALDAFNAAHLLPALAATGAAAFPLPPRVTDFEPVDLSVSG